jgi:hypothetical protein
MMDPAEIVGSKKMKKKVEEVVKKPKARIRDRDVKGKWWRCTVTEDEMRNLETKGFLKPHTCRVVPGAPTPTPEDGEMVLTKTLVERGLSLPRSGFII